MNKWMAFCALCAFANVCHSAPTQLRCTTLGEPGKTYSFEIAIDRTKNQVFVDGQYTTGVFISEAITSFVLADEKLGYAFDIYSNGRLIATHQKNHSTLIMQCA